MATVLVQMAGTIPVSQVPPLNPLTLTEGRVSQVQIQLAVLATRQHGSAVSPDLDTWGEGTVHPIRPLRIVA